MTNAFWGETEVKQVQAVSDCRLCGGSGVVRIMERYGRSAAGQFEVVEQRLVPPDMVPGLVYSEFPGMALTVCECSCTKQQKALRRLESALGQATVPDDCKLFNFEDFEHMAYAREALRLARLMVDSYVDETGVVHFYNDMRDGEGTEKPGMLLSGPTGTGKTTLSAVVFRARVGQGDPGSWVNFNDMIDRIRWTYEEDYSGPSQATIINAVMTAPFLVLDDLGSSTRSLQGKKEIFAEDAIEAVRKIFDHRLNKKLPTIITTNLNKDQLYAQFGPRAVSRLRGLCHAVEMVGKDFRIPEGQA